MKKENARGRKMRSANPKRRVVVTGCGVVSAIGNTFDEVVQALLEGRSGVRLLATDASRPPVAAAVPILEPPAQALSATDRAFFDPVTRYAMRATEDAIAKSGVLAGGSNGKGGGVYFGTAFGGAHSLEEMHRDIWYHGTSPKPLSYLCSLANAPAGHLAIRFGMHGPTYTYSVECASSAIAIGEAYRAVRDGSVPWALAGGAEAAATPAMLRSLQSMRILANVDAKAPHEACRPFSNERSGIVVGEGAAMLVLERMDHALARGAPVLCEIFGFASNCDASHLCIPSTGGQVRAMSQALLDAGLQDKDIDYINAHGSATRIGDVTESRSIRQTFAEHASVLAVSSTKAVHGHLIGAAAAVEFAVGIAALRERFIPATMHLSRPDPECDLDFVPNAPRRDTDIRYFMSNSFAFGGANAVLIGGRVE